MGTGVGYARVDVGGSGVGGPTPNVDGIEYVRVDGLVPGSDRRSGGLIGTKRHEQGSVWTGRGEVSGVSEVSEKDPSDIRHR